MIAIEETYDVSANVFGPVDQRKKAPPLIALKPRTLELVRWHRRYLTRRTTPAWRNDADLGLRDRACCDRDHRTRR
jgi:hypothetical protein